MNSVDASAYEVVPIGSIRPHPENPRQGDLDAIGASITKVGFYGAVIVQRSTGFILAGNHRWLALKAKRAKRIPVIWIDVDDATALRILIADNRVSDLGGYEPVALAELTSLVPADFLDALGLAAAGPAPQSRVIEHQPDTTGGNGDRSASEASYGERLEAFKAAETRSLVFDYPLDEYQEIQTLLPLLVAHYQVETNSDLFLTLVNAT